MPTPEKRDQYLRRTYDISLAEYESILEEQSGVCYVCQKPPDGRNLSVDHDHKTGFVRGLLCTYCNRYVVGRHRHAGILQRAAAYLENPPAFSVVGKRKAPKKRPKRRVRKPKQ